MPCWSFPAGRECSRWRCTADGTSASTARADRNDPYTAPMSRASGTPAPQDPPKGPAAIHAPWRQGYLDSMGEAERRSGPPDGSTGSFLLDYWLDPAADEANHVIVRTSDGII